MKTICKIAIAAIFFLSSTGLFAQKVDIVTLVATAEGKTKDEAITTALRGAIEQAFGAFISSKTEVVNDELIKDKIVSVSSGNIQKYDILSSTALPNGNTAITVQANVSIAKLTKFSKEKGIELEYDGDLFAANIKLQKLYEKNEIEVFKNLATIISEIVPDCYDYTISATEPTLFEPNAGVEEWKIDHTIGITGNKNLNNVQSILLTTIGGVSMSRADVEDYIKKKKKVYLVTLEGLQEDVVKKIAKNKKTDPAQAEKQFYIRNEVSYKVLCAIARMLNGIKYRCVIDNGVYKKYLYSEMGSGGDGANRWGAEQWSVALLTNSMPKRYTRLFETKGGYKYAGSEYFLLLPSGPERMEIIRDNLKKDKEHGRDYGSYNNKYNMMPYIYEWHLLNDRNIINPSNDAALWQNVVSYYDRGGFVTFSFQTSSGVKYTDILPLADVEKIKKYTIAPIKGVEVKVEVGSNLNNTETLKALQEHYNKGTEYIKEANSVKDWRSPKIKELETQGNAEFKKALDLFQKMPQQAHDKEVLKMVVEMYSRFRGESAEANTLYRKYKDELDTAY